MFTFKPYKKLMGFFFPNDPVYNCSMYLIAGCVHVDGFLCSFPDCSLNEW